MAQYYSTIGTRIVTLDNLHVTAFEKNQSVPSKREADLYWTTGYPLYRRLRGKQGNKLRKQKEIKQKLILCPHIISHIILASSNLNIVNEYL